MCIAYMEHSEMRNSKEWLEFGVYLPNLAGEAMGKSNYGKANGFLER